MRPLRKLAIGLWVAVFLLAGIRFGLVGRTPGDATTPTTTANTTVDSTAKTSDNSQPIDAEAAAATQVPVGGTLPPITLKDLKGESRSLSEWSGRTLLLNFWATWCAPCRKEMPLLQQFQEAEDPARLQVLGVAIDRRDAVLQFLGETGVTYPNLAGEMDATRAAELFAPGFALPLSVVVAPDGTVLAIHMGELRAADLQQVATVAAGLGAGTLDTPSAIAALRGGLGGGPGREAPAAP